MTAAARQRQQAGIVDEIRSVSLPPALADLVDRYAAVTDERDDLYWKWLYYVLPEFRLSSVSEEWIESARKAKFGLTVYMPVIDDIAEQYADRRTLMQGRKIPFDSATAATGDEVNAELIDLLAATWEFTDLHLRKAPRYDEFREVFEFDLRQSLNTMDFNRLVNETPELASSRTLELYDTHNMILLTYVDIDVAFSPDFSRADLPILRDVAWDAQRLARISNWVTTWERELEEEDYTSAVVVDALDRDVVSFDELRSDEVPTEVLADRIRNSGIEREHLLAWNDIYGRLVNEDHDTETVDIDAFVEGMRRVLEVDVKARGYK